MPDLSLKPSSVPVVWNAIRLFAPSPVQTTVPSILWWEWFFFLNYLVAFDLINEFQKGRLDIFIFTTRLTHSSYANLIGTRKSFYIKKSSTPTGQVDTSTVYFSAPYFVISSSCFCFVFETKCINQSQQNCDSLGRCCLKHSQHFRGMYFTKYHNSHIFWSTNFF